MMTHFYDRLQGWFHWSVGYDEVVRTAPETPCTIVELGCWLGRSSAYLGVEVVNSGKPIHLVCVDWFVGSWPEQLHTDAEPPFGQMRGSFDANLAPVAAALGERFHVITGRTQEVGATFVPPAPVWAVGVDAGHEYADVMGDLATWWPHIVSGGIMLGDDYAPAWPGVMRAVDEFFGQRGIPVESRPGLNGYPHFWVRKP